MTRHEPGAVSLEETSETPERTPLARPNAGNPPPLIYENEDWVVTDEGIASRAVVNGRPVDYVIEKSRLLRVRDLAGRPGISDWAVQVADKSWIKNTDLFVDALAEAVRVHHPDQVAIDLEATRVAARERRARFNPDQGTR